MRRRGGGSGIGRSERGSAESAKARGQAIGQISFLSVHPLQLSPRGAALGIFAVPLKTLSRDQSATIEGHP